MTFMYRNGAPESGKPERFSKSQSEAEDAEERLSHQITLKCVRDFNLFIYRLFICVRATWHVTSVIAAHLSPPVCVSLCSTRSLYHCLFQLSSITPSLLYTPPVSLNHPRLFPLYLLLLRKQPDAVCVCVCVSCTAVLWYISMQDVLMIKKRVL